MTAPSIRPEVVALCASFIPSDDDPPRWRHKDGSDLTAEEYGIVTTMTADEVQAAVDYYRLVGDFNEERERSTIATAEDVAYNFSIAVRSEYRAFRQHGSIEESMFGAFKPIVTVPQLVKEYNATIRAVRERRGPYDVPGGTGMVTEDGHPHWKPLEEIDDEREQESAIFTALAEAVELERLAAEARERAIALMAAFNDPKGFGLVDGDQAE